MKVLFLVLVECMNGTNVDSQNSCLSSITDGIGIISNGMVGTNCLNILVDATLHGVIANTRLSPVDGGSGSFLLQSFNLITFHVLNR